ncbi:MAG: HisA/HisF-related TIM barrel protein, partial [Candidatus Margulisiibacteriota bacterium]
TDIHCDGLLNGPNLSMLSNILLQTKVRLIASGGVSTVENIQSLGKLPGRSLEGFIVGKALYEGKLSMQEILEARDASS